MLSLRWKSPSTPLELAGVDDELVQLGKCNDVPAAVTAFLVDPLKLELLLLDLPSVFDIDPPAYY